MSTPILRKGDKIHIQFPEAGVNESGRLLTPDEVGASAERNAERYTDMYAQLGIQVIFWTASTNDPTFRIVTVFREES